MPDILGALGSAGRYGGEWLQNIADPKRQQHQRDAELLRQEWLLKNQSDLAKQSALNAGLRERTERESKTNELKAYLDAMRDSSLPPSLREHFGMQAGAPAEAFPRKPGLGPRALDPTGFIPQMNPLQEAQAFNYRATGQKALEPRAPNQWDFVQGLDPTQQARAVGGLNEAPIAAEPTEFDWLNSALKAAGLTVPKYGEGFFGDTYVQRPAVSQEVLQPITSRINQQAGLPGQGPGAPQAATGLPSMSTLKMMEDLRLASPQDKQETLDYLGTPEGQAYAQAEGIDMNRVLRGF